MVQKQRHIHITSYTSTLCQSYVLFYGTTSTTTNNSMKREVHSMVHSHTGTHTYTRSKAHPPFLQKFIPATTVEIDQYP